MEELSGSSTAGTWGACSHGDHREDGRGWRLGGVELVKLTRGHFWQHGPATPLLDVYTGEMKRLPHKTSEQFFPVALFIKDANWEWVMSLLAGKGLNIQTVGRGSAGKWLNCPCSSMDKFQTSHTETPAKHTLGKVDLRMGSLSRCQRKGEL